MNIYMILLFCIEIFTFTNAYVILEDFESDEFLNRWVQASHETYTYGIFIWSAGDTFFDPIKHKGLRATQDKKHYAYSTRFRYKINTDYAILTVQFQLKTEPSHTCSGGYIKILPHDFNQFTFGRKTRYYIMFGPDGCDETGKRIQVILNYKDTYYPINHVIVSPDDELSHLYTLILYPDNTFKVKIDNLVVWSGEINKFWKITPPEFIEDTNATKPADWDDREFIPDSNDLKPEGWDVGAMIPDPNVTKPEDWEEEFDGEWEQPYIPNPNHQGVWRPRMVRNPNYKGQWYPPSIKNPDFFVDSMMYKFDDIGGVGIEVWQLTAGSLFDNIMITDDPEYAAKYARNTWFPLHDYERQQLLLRQNFSKVERNEF